jgi:hypothetical protein
MLLCTVIPGGKPPGNEMKKFASVGRGRIRTRGCFTTASLQPGALQLASLASSNEPPRHLYGNPHLHFVFKQRHRLQVMGGIFGQIRNNAAEWVGTLQPSVLCSLWHLLLCAVA